MSKDFLKKIKKLFNFIFDISYLKYESEVEKLDGKESVVIDLGCGDGSFLRSLKSKFPQHKYIGVDVVIKESFSIDGARLISGNLLDFVETDEFFQAKVVILNDVLEHLNKEEIIKLLSSFNSLKKGAFVYCQFPNCASPFGLRNQTGDPTHKTMLSAEKIKRLIFEAGIKCHYETFGVEEVAGSSFGLFRYLTAFFYYKILCKVLNIVFAHSIGWNKYFWYPNLLIKIEMR